MRCDNCGHKWIKRVLRSWCEELSDVQIEQATAPAGYDQDYRKWPKGLYKRWEAHAYHCKRLIEQMRETKTWPGPPMLVLPDGTLDGNHRLRAVLYLQERGVKIVIPVQLQLRGG
jgi:hypothetical protein